MDFRIADIFFDSLARLVDRSFHDPACRFQLLWLLLCFSDLDWKQCSRRVLAFEPTFPIQPAPVEHQVRVHLMRTGHPRHRRSRLERFLDDPSSFGL